jgi:hypothetical protein
LQPPHAGGDGGVSGVGGRATTAGGGATTVAGGAAAVEAGAGNAITAGAAGAGGAAPGPCEGIEARCRPGEPVCDPRSGKRTTCGECGEPLPGGDEDCVRLLASDKESNGVCAVLGETRLECWHIWDQVEPSTLPRGVVQVLMSDDSANALASQCLRSQSGGYSCLKQASDCANVAVGDYGACGICAGKVHCEGDVETPEASPQSPVDLTITDDNAFVVGDLGVQANGYPARSPSWWAGAPVRLAVDHNAGGCIASDLDELACWMTLSDPLEPVRWSGRFRKLLPTTLPHACVLDDERQVSCGNVFDDASPAPLGAADALELVASAALVCALSVSGRVSCWQWTPAGALELLEVPTGW